MLCLEIGRNFLGMQTESLSLKTVSLETDSQGIITHHKDVICTQLRNTTIVLLPAFMQEES